MWFKQRIWYPHLSLSMFKLTKNNPHYTIFSVSNHQEYKWQHILILPVTLFQWCTWGESHWIWLVFLSSPSSTFNLDYYFHCCHLPPHHFHCGCHQCLPGYPQGFLWAWIYWLSTPLIILVQVALPYHNHRTFPPCPLCHEYLTWDARYKTWWTPVEYNT